MIEKQLEEQLKERLLVYRRLVWAVSAVIFLAGCVVVNLALAISAANSRVVVLQREINSLTKELEDLKVDSEQTFLQVSEIAPKPLFDSVRILNDPLFDAIDRCSLHDLPAPGGEVNALVSQSLWLRLARSGIPSIEQKSHEILLLAQKRSTRRPVSEYIQLCQNLGWTTKSDCEQLNNPVSALRESMERDAVVIACLRQTGQWEKVISAKPRVTAYFLKSGNQPQTLQR